MAADNTTGWYFIRLYAMLSIMALFSGCATTEANRVEPLSAYHFSERMIIGVMEITNKSEIPDLDFQKSGLGNLLLNELLNTKRFRIVEREKMNVILSELKLQHSGLIEETDAIEVGHHMDANALLFMAIDSVKHKTHTNHGGMAYTKTKKTEATVSARLVSVESNELLLSSMATEVTKQTKSVALGIVSSGSIEDQDAVDVVLKAATVQLANKIARQAPKMNDLK